MTKIVIGEYLPRETQAHIDLATLMETRLLLMANSGMGKSRGLRRFIEQVAGHEQQIVVDLEGEFPSLRERHDFVLAAAAGAGGDVDAHPRTAELLARRLRETRVSCILDLSELKAHLRHEFVQRFFDGLIEAPRSLWNPCVVVLDEAQVFAPEKGQGESEASSSVIDIATRGRKRGLCLVASTQRPSMLLKSVSAELKNRMIGGITEDTDVKRAAFNLGVTPAEARDRLRALVTGQFLAYGPAFAHNDPRLLHTGEVLTTHPRAGTRKSAPPKPTAAVIAMLPKLADLPKEVEKKAATEADLRREIADKSREIAEIRRQLAQAQKSNAAPDPELIAKTRIEAHQRGLRAGIDLTLREADVAWTRAAAIFKETLNDHRKSPLPDPPASAPKMPAGGQPVAHKAPIRTPEATMRPPPTPVSDAPQGDLPKGEAAVLTVCLQYPDGVTREQITGLTGYKRSTRNLYLQALARRGFIQDGPRITASEEGRAALPHFQPLPTGADLREYWHRRLPEGERKILALLIDAHPEAMQRDALDEAGYKRSTRNLYLQGLMRRELVQDVGRGSVKASDVLF